jgi:hypothetical protein
MDLGQTVITLTASGYQEIPGTWHTSCCSRRTFSVGQVCEYPCFAEAIGLAASNAVNGS